MTADVIQNAAPVSWQKILNSRSLRAHSQRRLLDKGCDSLVSFTLNTPGPIKQFPLAHQAILAGLVELRRVFHGFVLEEVLTRADTGSEVLLRLALPPERVKKETVSLEEFHPLGRLFDMDVIGPDGAAVSRKELGLPQRTCLICQQKAKVCARSQAHPMQELQAKMSEMLNKYFRGRWGDLCSSCAVRALLYEVAVTPKPGLVDRLNCGSHRDMDFFSFLDSSSVLAPWFYKMFCLGWDLADCSPGQLFQNLQFSGRQAEAEMFRATGGVNTHKGLIFSMGIVCAALGSVQARSSGMTVLDDVVSACRALGQCALQNFDGTAASAQTHGAQCLMEHGITGARGEAANGFPRAVEAALPVLRKWTADGASLNDACGGALLHLLAEVEDTNMIHRGGLDTALACRQQAASLLAVANRENICEILNGLDQTYMEQNLSPGGCADILALSLMFFFLEREGVLGKPPPPH